LDPVGATVGQRGARVQAVVAELAGEKIDVIPWSEDAGQFVANALSPAQVLGVDIDTEHRIANVTVPERMLSLAIGREGQNARLAARLTGWRIDIRSDVSVAEAKAEETRAAAAAAEPRPANVEPGAATVSAPDVAAIAAPAEEAAAQAAAAAPAVEAAPKRPRAGKPGEASATGGDAEARVESPPAAPKKPRASRTATDPG